MKRKLPVAAHLNDQEYMLLLQVYANHNSSMGLKKRVNYSLSHIVAVDRNHDEDCLNVYYNNGDCWHYTKDGKWY